MTTTFDKINQILDADMNEKKAEVKLKLVPVEVSSQGVKFGKAWYSHESITGYSADQLNDGNCHIIGKQYLKWLNSCTSVPPAGDVEVFAYYLHPLGDLEHGRFLKREDAKIADPSKSENHGTVTLIDRAHVTRLSADLHLASLARDARNDEITHQNNLRIEAQDHADKLQSDLTKARDLLTMTLRHIRNPTLEREVENFITHQSAPGAKVEPQIPAGLLALLQWMIGPGQCEEPLQFLRLWMHGEFDTCRKEWPEVPKECYTGAEVKDAPAAKREEHLCLLCLDEKTVPGPNAGDFVRDCPDCCGEEG